MRIEMDLRPDGSTTTDYSLIRQSLLAVIDDRHFHLYEGEPIVAHPNDLDCTIPTLTEAGANDERLDFVAAVLAHLRARQPTNTQT